MASTEGKKRIAPGFWGTAALVMGVAAVFRLILLAVGAFPFNADEAVVGLMARHILRGAWPTFFYGQAYLGSLDATLVAAGFALVGPSVGVIRAVQSLLYLATILTSMLLARRIGFGTGACAIAGLLLAVPPVLLTLYTTVSLGGYGEALLLGNLILFLTIGLLDRPRSWGAYAGWGVLAGFSLWTFGLTLVYSVPSAILLAAADLKRLPARRILSSAAAAIVGVLLGAAPMAAWGAVHGWRALLDELLGSAIAGASPAGFAAALGAHVVNLVLFGPTVVLGLRPPWGIAPLGIPLAPVVAVLWLAALAFGARRAAWPASGRSGRRLLAGLAITLLVGFTLTGFGADPSGRYFLPMMPALAIVAAAGVTWGASRLDRRLVYGVTALVLLFNGWTNLQAATSTEGMTTQFDASTRFDHAHDAELVTFLLGKGETRGYTTYWIAYPLAFLSDEKLVYLPHLPYHSDFRYTSRDDRYPPYRSEVEAAQQVAYVTARQPWLDAVLRDRLTALGVAFTETSIGDFRVFYALTRPVAPEAIGLGPGAEP